MWVIIFPNRSALTAVKEQRTEWEKDMWAAGADAYITGKFRQAVVKSRCSPDNAKYAYVVFARHDGTGGFGIQSLILKFFLRTTRRTP